MYKLDFIFEGNNELLSHTFESLTELNEFINGWHELEQPLSYQYISVL